MSYYDKQLKKNALITEKSTKRLLIKPSPSNEHKDQYFSTPKANKGKAVSKITPNKTMTENVQIKYYNISASRDKSLSPKGQIVIRSKDKEFKVTSNKKLNQAHHQTQQ